MWVDAAQGEILFAIDKPINKINFSSTYNTNGSYITGGPLYDMGRTLFNGILKILVEERKIIEDGALSIVQRLSLPLLLQLQELVR
jgi:hypothetical protein